MKPTIGLIAAALLASSGCGGSGDDDGNVVIPADASDVDAPRSGDCDAVAQTGCADGQKCAFVLDIPDTGVGHVACVPDGSAALGEACERPSAAGDVDTCAKGGHCYNGTCRQTCTRTNDTCDGQCGNFADANNNPLPVQWCLAACDPLAQDCGAANEGCVLSNDGGLCLIVGNTPEGEPCNFGNACAPGAACIGPAGGGACRTMCGAIDQIWGSNDEGLLTWPLCCGPNCADATKTCDGANEVCWVLGDGGTGVLNVGFCQTDDDASNTTGANPFVCSCATPVNPPEICGEIDPVAGAAPKSVPIAPAAVERAFFVAP